MRLFLLFIFSSGLSGLLLQCSTEHEKTEAVNFQTCSWGTADQVVIENGFFHSKQYLDTINNQLTGDTLVPIHFDKAMLIIEKMEPVKMELREVDGIEDFYITRIGWKKDTFLYDIKKHIDKFFLILISEHASSYVYELKEDHKILEQTNNIHIPEFEIEGYVIGDVINRDEIQILATDQFGTSLTETAVLNKNENVILEIIGGKYIHNIMLTQIKDAEIADLKENINAAFTITPDIQYFDEGKEEENQDILYFYWSENEVNVLLSRASEYGGKEQEWTLTYTNLLISNILRNYLKTVPESS